MQIEGVQSQKFSEKYIAFIDVIGFKKIVAASEAANNPHLITEVMRALHGNGGSSCYENSGPQILPETPYLYRNLNFEVTQFSDSILISAESSAAGLINLIGYSRSVVSTLLLRQKVLTRGVIVKGVVYHKGNIFFGSGYHKACELEKTTRAYADSHEFKGTPFVELDCDVVCDLSTCSQPGYQDMWKRMTWMDSRLEPSIVILDPFHQLLNIYGSNHNPLEIQQLIDLLESVGGGLLPPDANNERACKQYEIYQRVICEWIAKSNKIKHDVENLKKPILRMMSRAQAL